MNAAERVKRGVGTVGFMLISSVVFIGGVSAVYQGSRGRIELNERLAYRKSALYAAGLPVPVDAAAVDRQFADAVAVQERTVPGVRAWYRVRAGSGRRLLLELDGAGLWGTITALVALEADGKTLAGIDFIRQNETPGLGARIDEEWFQKQFRGKRGPVRSVGEETAAAADEFNGITGATVTTGAVRAIVNAALKAAASLPDGAAEGS